MPIYDLDPERAKMVACKNFSNHPRLLKCAIAPATPCLDCEHFERRETLEISDLQPDSGIISAPPLSAPLLSESERIARLLRLVPPLGRTLAAQFLDGRLLSALARVLVSPEGQTRGELRILLEGIPAVRFRPGLEDSRASPGYFMLVEFEIDAGFRVLMNPQQEETAPAPLPIYLIDSIYEAARLDNWHVNGTTSLCSTNARLKKPIPEHLKIVCLCAQGREDMLVLKPNDYE